ncbi:hypothetical protein G647_08255 [Cladophialophora carrionii CBS 160.54]|uniref:Alcohol acetyltransferase n=1 Tax=Cladophialophora carrionii CBS 160.54 TaxID=1279043 RepID=V9D0N7_9EURO|nr:uncharacterized protein G647_08255 [Cladophialophora carrionii CBS 160.54]ETI20221.1 hypothetical protein G647_08255 [Cladophialophora carrionii CBS 160.54]
MKNLENLRPVGRLERYSTARHDLKFYLGPAVTASYKLSKSYALPLKDYIYRVLGDVIAQHPILSAIPVDEHTQNPYFVRLSEIDLDQCVTFQVRQQDYPWEAETRDAELDELLGSQHSIPYEAPIPFWRLRVLYQSTHFTAAFFYHHALGDGQSGIAFHRTFHKALSSASTGSLAIPVPKIIATPSTPLLPNLEALHPLPVTIWYLLKVLFREWVLSKFWPARDPGLWTGGTCTAPLGQTRVRSLNIPALTTTALKNVCRENGTTITAALQTLIAGVLFAHLPDNFRGLACSGALSARRFLQKDARITDDVMGVFVQDMSESYNRHSFDAAQDSKRDISLLSWSEAQRSRRNIENILSLKGANAEANLLKYVNNFHEELFLSKIGKHRDKSFEVSNLGLVKPGTSAHGESDVEMGRMVFTQSAGVTAAAIQVSVVTGADGCLVLGITWQEGIVEDGLVHDALEGVAAEIERLTSKSQ